MDLRSRLKLLKEAADSPRRQNILLAQCKRDICFWFNTFCYTVDPRLDQTIVPFILYPIQEWFVREVSCAIVDQCDWGVEKSRDMGASWMVMLIYQYYWLFFDGWDFHVGSRKEKEVCEANADPSTLFGKFRVNWQWLPGWMAPPYNGRNSKKLSMYNPLTGSFVTGESANKAFGRGPRKRSVFLDEFAFWPYQNDVWKACGATTNSRGTSSTPDGGTNKYAKLMNDPENEVLTWTGLKQEMRRKGLLYLPETA